ncbi:1-(5-phosphoribosyl)-5-[(5-phosphoribosylamino)methylideneamino]imidazole-4-carboxamide isomerase [uncultured Sphaerochaeta sp.]|uniref:1-(5-phosphoribosyl)-5-[(5- phosphoribosylamino)methylideneamino]imidazole-4- carboxamide isomerase n=1 Tax=uncultured Sphaerochaeta sp. TaxID=886478 RepID=UPI002A0A719A|nr:1-(5-phosphoribosyl)-5-[(5-phosphoribosylamino)methylideneamino]imidazole-4-carboxamide isomerase [uncultured Sphaerochaeta sp.]
MHIIPAIDIIDGKAVRLTQGDYASKKIYASDPLDLAKQFEDANLRYLHVVDLDGAKGKGIVNLKSLERIASNTNLIIDFGGGIKRSEDLEAAFSSGASKVTCGSVAVKNPSLLISWIEEFGCDRLILGADAKDGMVQSAGWTEGSDQEVAAFIDLYRSQGLYQVICTDIAKDGMLSGPSLDLYRTLLKERDDLHLIASGGITTLQDLRDLQEAGLSGAIIGKAIYEGKITIEELAAFGEE